MKTTNRILLIAATTAALTLNAGVSGSEPAKAACVPINQALASSPRFLEEHPELLRAPASNGEAQAKADRMNKQLAKLMENSALASSPRFLEEHPELLRPASSAEEAQAKATRNRNQLEKLMENRAWAASPRTLEQFPELSRAYTSEPAKQSFELAPLK